jgi:hypothetical protein
MPPATSPAAKVAALAIGTVTNVAAARTDPNIIQRNASSRALDEDARKFGGGSLSGAGGPPR